MKKLLLLSILLLPVRLLAQSTTVSGQVTDSAGQSWNNGTYAFQFIPSPGLPTTPSTWTGGTLALSINGVLNGTGGYSQSVPDNATITPAGSKWRLLVCSGTTPISCFSQIQTITGASQTVNVTPPALSIPPGAGNSVYNTNEVSGANIGSIVYLIGTGLQACSAVTGTTCTTWVSGGGGGSGLPVGGSVGQTVVNTGPGVGTWQNYSYPNLASFPAACGANQVATQIGATPGCVTLTASFLPSTVVNSVVNDTNVTGSISAQALTLNWTGTLAVARGGIGVGTLTGIPKGNGTSPFTVAVATDLPGSGAATVNGQTCTLGSTCNVNVGAATNSVALNQGNGAAQTGVTGVITSSVFSANNGAAPSFKVVGFPGTDVNAATYTVQCDSATTTIDRATTLRFITTAPTVTMPDPTTSGCGNNFPVTLIASGVTATINRTTTAVFNIYGRSGDPTLAATTFNLTTGQYATITSPDNTNWLVRVVPAAAGGGLPAHLTYTDPTLTVSAAGFGNGQLALSGNTSGTVTFTAPAVAGTSTNPIAISNVMLAPVGASATVSYGFTGLPSTGMYTRLDGGSRQRIFFSQNGSDQVAMGFDGNANAFAWLSAGTIGFASSSGFVTDTAFSKPAAGVIAVGNGVPSDTSGKLKAAAYMSLGTKFTASGCTNSATVGGATAGQFTSGTTGACTVTITMGNSATAPNGWACAASDQTTPGNIYDQTTGGSATTAVLTGTTVSGDVISFHCVGY